jgi:hypothetical protein
MEWRVSMRVSFIIVLLKNDGFSTLSHQDSPSDEIMVVTAF